MDRGNDSGSRCCSKDVLRSMLSNRSHLDLSDEIHFGEPLLKAHGGFCDVFQGSWISQGVCIYKVAIKRLRAHIQTDRDFAKQLAKEIRVWSGLYHRNILPLLGYVIEGEYPSLVAEWMENGTVSRYMRQNPDTDLLQMILGIARGLEYIHSKGVIHSDIKADNILVSRFGEPVICDFGISRIISASQSFGETSGHKVKGSVRWMARELLADAQSIHSKESDIWAFGMTIYELLTKRIPFYDIKRDVQVMFTILQGYTPSRPEAFIDWPIYWQKLWSICFVSWNRYPQLRKPMSEIVSYVELLCRHAEEERSSRNAKNLSEASEVEDNSVYHQASILGQDDYEPPPEAYNSCSNPIKLKLTDSDSDGKERLRDASRQRLIMDGPSCFSPPRRANTRETLPHRMRTPSLGCKDIIRDFDLRQSSVGPAQKTMLPQTEERLDLVKKWQETLKFKADTTDGNPSYEPEVQYLSIPAHSTPAHAMSRRSLSSSTGSSTIVASTCTEDPPAMTEIDNSETSRKNNGPLLPESSESVQASTDIFHFSNHRTLRRRNGTVSRIKI